MTRSFSLFFTRGATRNDAEYGGVYGNVTLSPILISSSLPSSFVSPPKLLLELAIVSDHGNDPKATFLRMVSLAPRCGIK
jgi:hypothetical protein